MHKVLNESPVPLEQLQPTIDRGVVTIVARALEKDPQRRYQELSTMRAELAIVRQRLENQVDQEAQTLVAPPPAGTHSSPPSSHSSHPSRAATGTGRIGGHHRASLQKKRDAQISSLLGKARQAFDEGALEKAKEAVEQALMFDTEHPLATQLLEEITVEEERKIVAEFVAKARTELQAGRFDEAERIVNEGLSIVPHSTDIQQLREAVETARKEIERARQIQDMLRRARARFSEGSFEGAIRAVGELLAIDPGNTAAIELQGRAQAAIDARGKRVHHDAAAQALIGEARKLFDSGDKAAAISKLEAFSPPHDLVTGFLASLRGEQIAEALPDVLPETLVAQNPPTMAFMPGRSKESPAVHVGSGSRAPIYVGVAVAVALLVAVGVWLMTRPTEPAVNPAATAAPTSADTSPAPAPAPTPAPAVPPPPVVAPPTSLASVNEKDREDVFAAYKLIGIGDLAGAARIVAQIAKRDPKNADLRELRSAIQKVQQAEKERLDELAAANARAATAATAPASAPPESAAPSNPNPAPAPAPAPSNPDPVAPTPPKPASSEPAFTVLPGGGFAANSEPPSPAMLGELERPAIEAVVQQYASALNGRNMKAASQARTFTPAEARNWENTFKNYALFQLSAKVLETPLVTGDRGTVKVEERLQYTQRRGGIQITQNPNVIVYRLEKIGGKWHILPPGGS
jgi:tetratricopeptide (TPR) repeat protein